MDEVMAPRPLFFIGNKRSGTSHLVRLLNMHPNIFVSHEADTIWILYQAIKGKAFRRYLWDGPYGMQATLDVCSGILASDPKATIRSWGVREAFFRIEDLLMRKGSNVQACYEKQALKWIGDKKPVQQADPELHPFMMEHFPDARYIHIIRDPRAVVISALRFKGQGKVDYWNKSSDQVLTRWAIHEEWVLAVKEQDNLNVISVRFEDLCERPREVMTELYEFLELPATDAVLQQNKEATSRGMNDKYRGSKLRIAKRARRVMDVYGY